MTITSLSERKKAIRAQQSAPTADVVCRIQAEMDGPNLSIEFRKLGHPAGLGSATEAFAQIVKTTPLATEATWSGEMKVSLVLAPEHSWPEVREELFALVADTFGVPAERVTAVTHLRLASKQSRF